MNYTDVNGIVEKFQDDQNFQKELLPLVQELPDLIASAEYYFGPRDSSIMFDLKFEGRAYTDFGKTPVLITLGDAQNFVNDIPQAKFLLCQELTQIFSKPTSKGNDLVWRNLDKGISTYFTLLKNPTGPWISGTYEKAQRLFIKLVGICGETVIKEIREIRWGKNLSTSFADINFDDFHNILPKLPDAIISDLLEEWNQVTPKIPNEKLWVNL